MSEGFSWQRAASEIDETQNQSWMNKVKVKHKRKAMEEGGLEARI